MFRVSNNLVGILNFFTLIFSIPILVTGIWLHREATSACERWLDKPLIVLGVFLLLVSLAGLIGACCEVTWLLWIYLVVMFLLILISFAFTIFAFAVTNKGAGEAVSNRGYKEYRLGDYSNWLQKRVDGKNWQRIKSCLQDSKFCTAMHDKYGSDAATKFYTENLSSVQSGCCKPPSYCNFTYVSPTEWNKGANPGAVTGDCSVWNNDPTLLCYNCDSCKAGFLDNLRRQWKKTAIVNIIFLIFLVVVYSVGCCAFRNSRRDNWRK